MEKVDRWFLASSAIGALNTVNAYRPLAGRGIGGVLAFATGWPTSEAPLLAIGVQGTGVAAWARRGPLRSPLGKAGLALTVGSWIGLARLARRAAHTADLLDEHLREGLGPSYRAEVPEHARSEAPLTITERTLPSLGERRRFRATRGLTYGDHGRRNRLDIWSANDLPRSAHAPVVLHVHGGGWVLGNEQVQGEVLLSEMAAAAGSG